MQCSLTIAFRFVWLGAGWGECEYLERAAEFQIALVPMVSSIRMSK